MTNDQHAAKAAEIFCGVTATQPKDNGPPFASNIAESSYQALLSAGVHCTRDQFRPSVQAFREEEDKSRREYEGDTTDSLVGWKVISVGKDSLLLESPQGHHRRYDFWATTPTLLPYKDLPDTVGTWDRDGVRYKVYRYGLFEPLRLQAMDANGLQLNEIPFGERPIGHWLKCEPPTAVNKIESLKPLIAVQMVEIEQLCKERDELKMELDKIIDLLVDERVTSHNLKAELAAMKESCEYFKDRHNEALIKLADLQNKYDSLRSGSKSDESDYRTRVMNDVLELLRCGESITLKREPTTVQVIISQPPNQFDGGVLEVEEMLDLDCIHDSRSDAIGLTAGRLLHQLRDAQNKPANG